MGHDTDSRRARCAGDEARNAYFQSVFNICRGDYSVSEQETADGKGMGDSVDYKDAIRLTQSKVVIGMNIRNTTV